MFAVVVVVVVVVVAATGRPCCSLMSNVCGREAKVSLCRERSNTNSTLMENL